MAEQRLPGVLILHPGAELYGPDRIMLEIVRGLASRFHILVVVPFEGPLVGMLRQAGAEVRVQGLAILRRQYFNPCGLINRILAMRRSYASLKRLTATGEFTLIHSNTSAVLVGALLARRLRVPHVWHIHEIMTRPLWFHRVMSAIIARGATRVVAVSEAVRAHLIKGDKANAARAIVIHNGIEPPSASDSARTRVREALGVRAEEVLIGMVGRVNWLKGQDALLDAAAMMLPEALPVKFVLIGDSFRGQEHLFENLKRRAKSMAPPGVVIVEGFRDDIGDVMRALDIFVLPSTQPDSFPTVVLEAMWSGCAIVGFRHGGIAEMIVDGESGRLVPPLDVVALSATLRELVADPQSRARLGQAARNRVAEQFSRSAFVSRFDALYSSLTSGRDTEASCNHAHLT